MRRSFFTPFAKAQAAGLVLGFATALAATLITGAGVRVFLIATAMAWLGWEFILGPRAPSHANTPRVLLYAGLSGFAFPWVGFLLAALAAALRP